MAVANNRFAIVSEEEIEEISKNAVPDKTKKATKYGLIVFQGKRMIKYLFKLHFLWKT